MNNLSKHVRSDKAKWIITGIVFVLILAILGGVVAAVVTETNPKDWFKNPSEGGAEEAPLEGAVIENGVEDGVRIISSKIAPNDYALNNVLSSADTAYSISATIVPSTAENKIINWSVAWNNASSEWAQGKIVTDYVIIGAKTSESGESITVTCLKDFGESIVITATSAGDESIKATCRVEYIKKVIAVNYTFKYGDNPIESIVADEDGVYRFDYTGEEKSYVFTPVPLYSNYTLDISYTSSISGKYTDAFGYGSDVNLDSSSLLAGLSNIVLEPELSDKGKDFVSRVKSIHPSEMRWQGMAPAYTAAMNIYAELSGTDLTHSLVVNAHAALLSVDGPGVFIQGQDSAWKAAQKLQDVLNSYTAPVSSGDFMGGIEISSVDMLLQAAKACNAAKKGIVEYTVTFANDDFTYGFKISLGYTEGSLNVVRGIESSVPVIVF